MPGAPIGRIRWFAVNAEGSRVASGVREARVEDVEIVPKRSTRGHQLWMGIFRRLVGKIDPTVGDISEARRNLIPVAGERYEKRIKRTKDDPNREVGPVWFTKRVWLDETFYIELSEHPGRKKGFGLAVGRANEDNFSWEWFEPPTAGVTKKLQEGGVLFVTDTETPNGVELAYMRFDTDVSLRIIPMGLAAARLKPIWRINVHSGSEISWPFLVDGEVVSSGRLDS